MTGGCCGLWQARCAASSHSARCRRPTEGLSQLERCYVALAHHRPGCGLSWARLFCDGLALTDLTMSSSSRPIGEVLQGVGNRTAIWAIQMPHAGHVDCVRGWRLTGSRHVWCAEVLSGARKWCAMSCRHMLEEASPSVLDQYLFPVLLAGGVRGVVWKGATANKPYSGTTR